MFSDEHKMTKNIYSYFQTPKTIYYQRHKDKLFLTKLKTEFQYYGLL